MVVLLVPGVKGVVTAVFQLTQVGKLSGSQHLIQVAEGGDGWHQLDSPFIAVVIQLDDFLRCQRVVAAPHLAEIAEEVGVLDVQLHLVKLIFGQLICQLL